MFNNVFLQGLRQILCRLIHLLLLFVFSLMQYIQTAAALATQEGTYSLWYRQTEQNRIHTLFSRLPRIHFSQPDIISNQQTQNESSYQRVVSFSKCMAVVLQFSGANGGYYLGYFLKGHNLCVHFIITQFQIYHPNWLNGCLCQHVGETGSRDFICIKSTPCRNLKARQFY